MRKKEMQISQDELVRRLRSVGMNESVARLAVIMHIYRYERAEEGIIRIVGRHVGLEDHSVAGRAVSELKGMKWLVPLSFHGWPYLAAAPDIARMMAEKLNDLSLEGQIQQLRVAPDSDSVRILGGMNKIEVYVTFLEALSSAKNEICLPMLATSPDQYSLPIIQERAKKGVRVRILLGSPELVSQLRGEHQKYRAEEAFKEWKNSAKGIKKIQVRVVHTVDDMLIASGLSVDGRLVRSDVVDLHRPTLEGIMVKFEPSGSNDTLNMVRLFQLYFDDVWRRAKPRGFFRTLWWRLAKGWQWGLFALFALLGLIINTSLKDTFWTGVVGSVAATFLVNALVATGPTIWALVRAVYEYIKMH
jgi:hypothetical protein